MAKGPIREVDRSFAGQVSTATNLIQRNLDMLSLEPMAVLTALMRLLCVFLVTELMHLPTKQVRAQAFKLFRMNLDEALERFALARSMEEKANDQ